MNKPAVTLAVVAILILLAFGVCRYFGDAGGAKAAFEPNPPSRLDRSNILREEMKADQSRTDKTKPSDSDFSGYMVDGSAVEA